MSEILSLCTHLIIGYGGVSPEGDFNDLEQRLSSTENLKAFIKNSKSLFKNLKILLGIGGDADNANEKYLTMVSNSKHS